ncbi:uncharacterized protein LOC134197925, partial [Corticium candelabrum]|uniref:uncharacterized protein LOC134197925 n=1 Tax=Corticium candelabrum TaxID=121492 RepID=UPI002E256AB0
FIYAVSTRGYYPAYTNLQKFISKANVLIATVTGDRARTVERQSDEKTVAEVMSVVRKMFGSTVPDPIETFVTKWGTNPFFYGAYSNWPVGFTNDNFEDTRASVGGSVFFAGEAMSKRHYGFLHGAYSSGQDAAACIVSNITRQSTTNCPKDLPAESNSSKRVVITLAVSVPLVVLLVL